MSTKKNRKARLDPKGDAKPLTEIRGSFRIGECISPLASSADSYTIINVDPHQK